MNLVGHTHRFREAAASVHGDQALIRGAKIIALMGLELIIYNIFIIQIT
jgi:hypothetical protein